MDTRTTDPVLQEILGQLVVDEGGALLPAERFDAWMRALPERYPRAQHHDLYGQLVSVALLFARRRWPAAVQLYALSTL